MGLKLSLLGQLHSFKFRNENRDTKLEVKQMQNYRKSSHYMYDIKYHLVWITKYRKPVIIGKIAVRTRELIRIICQSNEIEILAGHVGSDHIHLLVAVPYICKQVGAVYKRKYIQKVAIKEYIKNQDLQERRTLTIDSL